VLCLKMILPASLGATIILSVLLAVYYGNVNVKAQFSIESINNLSRVLAQTPQITVGADPTDIQINTDTGKIYVANKGSNSVSVIEPCN